ncbi:MAG: EAL domain-containing protein, partial [Oscillospiraceae bacterium]|nr:EAL domain-containing protein [Oscillospiraceae bacterium]
EIELTETTTDVEFKDLKRTIRGLQKAGISTSVDDFGIGYSSLNLIKEIPWNVLKLDKTLLPDKGDENPVQKGVMFKYVIAMAQEMGLECIAEGVETEEQVRLLADNKCNLAQGFYFDRPLPVAEFETRFDKKYL